MAVLGRLVLAGLAGAGAYAAWQALRQPQSGVGRLAGSVGSAAGTIAGAAVDAAREGAATTGGGTPTGRPPTTGVTAGAAPVGSGPGAPSGAGGRADFTATTTALDGAVGPERDRLQVPSTGGADPAAGADVEGAAGSPASGTRGDDPLTGITEPATHLPEASASPDGTPAASPVETRRVGEDPA
jgi:hypothetical protein